MGALHDEGVLLGEPGLELGHPSGGDPDKSRLAGVVLPSLKQTLAEPCDILGADPELLRHPDLAVGDPKPDYFRRVLFFKLLS